MRLGACGLEQLDRVAGTPPEVRKGRDSVLGPARPGLSQCGSGGLSDGLVLFAFAAADADRADDPAVPLQRNSTREDHDAVVVRGCDAVELLAWLCLFGEVGSGQ